MFLFVVFAIFVTRMVLKNFFAQACSVDMRINFGSCDTLVPQHSLYYTQVGPTLKKMSGKGVTKSVRTDIFLNPRSLDEFFNNMKDRYSRKRFTASLTDEHIILIPGFYLDVVAVVEIVI